MANSRRIEEELSKVQDVIERLGKNMNTITPSWSKLAELLASSDVTSSLFWDINQAVIDIWFENPSLDLQHIETAFRAREEGDKSLWLIGLQGVIDPKTCYIGCPVPGAEGSSIVPSVTKTFSMWLIWRDPHSAMEEILVRTGVGYEENFKRLASTGVGVMRGL
jgi:hypothetical protein